MHARLVSIQVGMPQLVTLTDQNHRDPWCTGFLKSPVFEPVWLGKVNLIGDGQADLKHHGGPDKAVCVYPEKHYPDWREELGLPDLGYGDFGENFTVVGLAESDICIGDIWEVGEATVQVSQPRQPCWKLARRWDIKDLAYRVQTSGRTGWYFRVLTEGSVQTGQPLTLVDRSHADWSIEAANRVMHHDKRNLLAAAELAALPQLSASWKKTLTNRAEQDIEVDERLRLDGHQD